MLSDLQTELLVAISPAVGKQDKLVDAFAREARLELLEAHLQALPELRTSTRLQETQARSCNGEILRLGRGDHDLGAIAEGNNRGWGGRMQAPRNTSRGPG